MNFIFFTSSGTASIVKPQEEPSSLIKLVFEDSNDDADVSMQRITIRIKEEIKMISKRKKYNAINVPNVETLY